MSRLRHVAFMTPTLPLQPLSRSQRDRMATVSASPPPAPHNWVLQAEILSTRWALPSTMTGQPGGVSPGTSLWESGEQQPNWSEAERESTCVRGVICKNADITSRTQDRIPPCHRRTALSVLLGLPQGLLSLFDKAWALRLWEFQKTFQFLLLLSFLLLYRDTHLLILSPLNCLHCTYQHLNLFYHIS